MRRREKRILVSFFLVMLTLPLGSQELGRSAPTVVGAEPQAFFDRRTLLAVTNPGYLVSPGDVYTLSYNREQVRVTQTLIVEPDMTVDLSIFGKESVDNLTFIEFRRLVQKKVLTAYPTSLPQVTIRSTGVFEVLLRGEVVQAGYKLAWGLTRLSEMVREELTPYSSTRNIQIISSKGRSRFCDLYRAFRAGDQEQDPFLRPGDTIILSKYGRQVTVEGEVERPGSYQLLSGESLQEAIMGFGSGPTGAADLSRVELRQYDPVKKIEEIRYVDISEGHDRGIALRNGDSIYVPSRTELLPVIYFEGAIVPQGENPQERVLIYRQRHTIRRGETLYTALRGVTLSAQADLPACYIKRKNQKIFVDLDDYLYNYDPRKDVVLEPLDRVVIPYIR
ncbi:MAG: SLBB domain-containing protein [Spirochaetales bacterium]|nr:SLBB domain-containing protein [Spirochaetales bacterium]